jgi:hypothetical protein
MTQLHRIVWLPLVVFACGGAGEAGVYDATFSAVSTFSRPAWPATSYADTGVITVSDTGTGIELEWQVGSNPPSGVIAFEPAAGGWRATGGSAWMGTLTNGSVQTSWCDVCGLRFEGDRLVQDQQGHFEGTTPLGEAYAGTYSGTWTGTRR